MTTGPPPNQHQNDQINNNSNAFNVENNNQSDNPSDEENTSEYSPDPSSRHSTMDSHAEYPHNNVEARDQQLINRLNNNFQQSLSTSMESDNILNNNDIESDAGVDPLVNSTSSNTSAPAGAPVDNSTTGMADSNDNGVQESRQQQQKQLAVN